MALLTNAIKSSFVKEFFRSLTDPRSVNKYFIFYGGAKAREDESTVPSISDTVQEENEAKRQAMFYNHILPSDVSLMVRRYDWLSGTVYDQYEDDVDLSDKKYYVLVLSQNEYRVYMCLSNNSGAVSTSSPEGTSTQEIRMADGYVWKFMYSFTEQMEAFLTDTYMPITEISDISYSDERALALDVKLDSVSGFIEKITVDGTSPIYTDLVNPDMTSTHTVSTVNNLVFTVNLRSDLATSSNYYNNDYIVLFDSGKVGTIRTYTVSGNTATIELCEIYPDTGAGNISTGDIYSILPKVNIVGNGYGAVAYPVFDNNLLTSIEVVDGGTDYSFAQVYLMAGDDVTVSAVIPPDGGYGFDIINELRPRHLLINKEFNYSLVDSGNERFFGVGASVRQYGIIQNLKTDEDSVVPNDYQHFDMELLVDQDATIQGENYYYNSLLDFNLSTLTSNSTHIIGADTFSSAKVEELTINPTDSRLFNLVVSEVNGVFENAKLNANGDVILGERIVFVNKTQSGISNDFSVVYAPKSVYSFTQSSTSNTIPDNLRTSVVQKLQLTRNGSTLFSDAVIPVGSYLYREAVELTSGNTIPAASAYVLSIGSRQPTGSDSIAYVYVLAEKGSFEVDDTVMCVADPFAKTVELYDSTCAGNAGVSVSVSQTASTSDGVYVNKYSGNVLYIQNIEQLALATNTIFTTRILLGF